MQSACWRFRSDNVTELAPLGSFYRGPGTDYFELRRDPPIEVERLQHRIEALGFAVTITHMMA